MRRVILVMTTALLICSLMSGSARAQSSAVNTATSAASGTPPPQAAGLLGLIQAAAGAIKKLKAKCCKCPCGQMISGLEAQLNMMLGGLLCPPCCPPVDPDDAKQPSTTAAGACAKIVQEELDVPNRRRAVRCLSRADCNWWPEVEVALIAALRADRSECVRLEAAWALGKGCCCTKKTMEALLIAATGSKKDGNPPENSERVKMAALAALQHCLCFYSEEADEPKRPEMPPEKQGAGKEIAGLGKPGALDLLAAEPDDPRIRKLWYYFQLDDKPKAQTYAEARQALHRVQAQQAQYVQQQPYPTGKRNLYQIMLNAVEPSRLASSAAPALAPSHASNAPELAAPASPPLSRATLSFVE